MLYSPFCLQTPTTGISVSNTTGESSILQSAYTIPSGIIKNGQAFRIYLGGNITHLNGEVLTTRIYLGTGAIIDTGGVNLGSPRNSGTYELESILICRSSGVGGQFNAGSIYYITTTNDDSIMNHTNNNSNTTINTTTGNNIDVKVLWFTASTGNNLKVTRSIIESFG